MAAALQSARALNWALLLSRYEGRRRRYGPIITSDTLFNYRRREDTGADCANYRIVVRKADHLARGLTFSSPLSANPRRALVGWSRAIFTL